MKKPWREIKEMKARFCELALGLCVFFGPWAADKVCAQAASSQGNGLALHLTLAQAIEEALKANPSLKARGHQSRAAESEAKAADRSRWGALNAVGSYSYLNDDQIIRPMSSELMANGILGAPWDRSQAHYGLSYEIPLYLGGRLHNQIQIAKLEAKRSAELHEGTRWQVRFNVVSLYSSLQALEQAALALDGQIAALTQTRTNLDQMVSIGKRPEVDRLKVIEELEAARASHASLGADRRKVASLLLSVVGRDPAIELEVDPQTAPSMAATSGSALPLTVDDNSAIRAAKLAAEQAARGVKVARSDLLPRVIASANVFEHTGTRTDRDEETWGATVSVVLPLFEGGSRLLRVSAARARQAAAEEALRQAQLQTLAAWQDAVAKLEAAQTNLAAAAARVTAAAEAARIEQVRYDTGSSTIEDLLRARYREQAARAALATARADFVISAERINTIAEKEILP
ncbi:MAG: TolC family protein [Verrucomicrobia bacterium]|nr:TolC family protein [Verrucomicrobiota bacterium]